MTKKKVAALFGKCALGLKNIFATAVPTRSKPIIFSGPSHSGLETLEDLEKKTRSSGTDAGRASLAAKRKALDCAVIEVAAHLKCTPAISNEFATMAQPYLVEKLGYEPGIEAIKGSVRRIRQKG